MNNKNNNKNNNNKNKKINMIKDNIINKETNNYSYN